MHIKTKLKLDMTYKPYWSLTFENGTVVRLEVISQTFDINDSFNKWKQYEMASNRMAKEIMAQGGREIQLEIAKGLLQED